jgi:hypothetical protein
MESLRPSETPRAMRSHGSGSPNGRAIPAVVFWLGLVLLSASLYLIQVAVFRKGADTEFYLLQDLAFLPVQVLLATVLVNGFVTRREKRVLLHKMNMVIGTFYAEAGTELLKRLARLDTASAELGLRLAVGRDWTSRQFGDAAAHVRSHKARIDASKDDLALLASYLKSQRDLFLRLLENPNLLEHDAFTDLLWAVFHVSDELGHRPDLGRLSDSDRNHLMTDIERAYKHLIVEWIAYVQHLKNDYPYLFSLAVRTNPFDPNANVAVQ